MFTIGVIRKILSRHNYPTNGIGVYEIEICIKTSYEAGYDVVAKRTSSIEAYRYLYYEHKIEIK